MLCRNNFVVGVTNKVVIESKINVSTEGRDAGRYVTAVFNIFHAELLIVVRSSCVFHPLEAIDK